MLLNIAAIGMVSNAAMALMYTMQMKAVAPLMYG